MDCPWIRRTERQRLHAHAPEVVPARSWARFSIRRCHGTVSNLFLCHVNSLAWPMRRRPVSASGAARAALRLLWSLIPLAERHAHERLARPMRSKLDRAGAAAHWLGKPLFLAWPPLRAWPDRQLPGGWRRHPACHGAHWPPRHAGSHAAWWRSAGPGARAEVVVQILDGSQHTKSSN